MHSNQFAIVNMFSTGLPITARSLFTKMGRCISVGNLTNNASKVASFSVPVNPFSLYALSRFRSSVFAGTFSFCIRSFSSAKDKGFFLYSRYSNAMLLSLSKATALRQVLQDFVQISSFICYLQDVSMDKLFYYYWFDTVKVAFWMVYRIRWRMR